LASPFLICDGIFSSQLVAPQLADEVNMYRRWGDCQEHVVSITKGQLIGDHDGK